jgi:hypothetical protein
LPSEAARGTPPVSETQVGGGIDRNLFAQGEAAAKRLLGFGAIKAEIDADLQRSFAEQQQRS